MKPSLLEHLCLHRLISLIFQVSTIPINHTHIDYVSWFVSGFPPQNVTVTDEGMSIAGYSDYSLLCTVNRNQHLSSSSMISIQWLGPDGLEVSEENQFIITSSEESTNDIVVTSSLIFNSLLTSQAGEYTCRTSMTIPGTDVLNYTVDQTFIVSVKCKWQAEKLVSIRQSSYT